MSGLLAAFFLARLALPAVPSALRQRLYPWLAARVLPAASSANRRHRLATAKPPPSPFLTMPPPRAAAALPPPPLPPFRL